ncbi:MAG: hypothetical protein M3Z50_10685 [Actinomycetota bacterium]|nr:hypothetical protein [Actinomycetota bacterium]
MKKVLLAFCAPLVLMLVASACGGSSSPKLSPDETKVSHNLVAYYQASSSGGVPKKAISCFADKFVQDAGVPALKKAKVVNADSSVNKQSVQLPPDLAGKFADAYLACVDYASSQAKAMAKQDPKIDEAKLATCIGKVLDKPTYKRVIVDSLTKKSEPQLQKTLTPKLLQCQKDSAKK